ncbi:MAG TPA: divalent-cation tolerance protein CutA [Limnobacter sp.]|nr:divalent-cation tolerance protein CutA [Limnobacter sp.]
MGNKTGGQGVWMAYTTWPDQAQASAFAHDVVGRALVACASVSGPVVSHYFWQGKLEQSEEWLVTLKLCDAQRDALKLHVATSHPYEVPELLLFEVGDGLSSYLQWVRDSAGQEPDRDLT